MNSTYRIFKGRGIYVSPDLSVRRVFAERGFAMSSGTTDEWTKDEEENL
ncbi:MAG: hypothetical protein J6K28_00725 [Alistipes sp.]|nr:hypothetical protein [Alistipes sp.]